MMGQEHRNANQIAGEPVQTTTKKDYNLAMKSTNAPKPETTTPAKKAPKPKRLYAKKGSPLLIACHKGAHYVSSEKSVFTVEDKVVVTGEKGDATVQVSSPDGAREESWALKGSYTESAPASEKSAKERTVDRMVAETVAKANFIPSEEGAERIRASLERVKAKQVA